MLVLTTSNKTIVYIWCLSQYTIEVTSSNQRKIQTCLPQELKTAIWECWGIKARNIPKRSNLVVDLKCTAGRKCRLNRAHSTTRPIWMPNKVNIPNTWSLVAVLRTPLITCTLEMRQPRLITLFRTWVVELKIKPRWSKRESSVKSSRRNKSSHNNWLRAALRKTIAWLDRSKEDRKRLACRWREARTKTLKAKWGQCTCAARAETPLLVAQQWMITLSRLLTG